MENRSFERFFLEDILVASQDELVEQARMLITRLERVSVDSIWARRSSGVRGALLKWVELMDERDNQGGRKLSPEALRELELTVESGFDHLARAARERYPE